MKTYPREQFKDLLDAYAGGQVVNWKSDIYKLIGKVDDPLIVCKTNDSCVGLFWADGTKSSYNPADFVVATPQPHGSDDIVKQLETYRLNVGGTALALRRLAAAAGGCPSNPELDAALSEAWPLCRGEAGKMSSGAETVLVFAARYTHDRNTGGAFVVIRELRRVWVNLSKATRDMLIKESHEATANVDEWEEFRNKYKNL